MKSDMPEILFLASYKVVDYGNKLKFLVPSNKVVMQIIYSISWILIWLIIGSNITFSLNPVWIYLIWIAALVSPVYTLLWNFLGQEITLVSNESIIISRKILGIGVVKRYEADKTANLHVDEVKENWFLFKDDEMKNPEIGCKSILFYYGAKTVKIVSSIVEAEALQILETIQKRFPTYKDDYVVKMMSDRK